MKFLYFYEDILTEARSMSDEKFEWITKNLGEWLFNDLVEKPVLVNSIPGIERFKNYLKVRTTEKANSDEDIVSALDRLEDFLNMLSPRDSQTMIKAIMEKFPNVRYKISRFGKPELTGSKRGRKPGSKNKPKEKIDTFTTISKPISTAPPAPQMAPTIQEPKKRGRKSIDSPFTAIERHIYKKEGPEKIKKLEDKVEELDNEVTQTIVRIKKIMADIEKRKKFFGIE